MLYSYIPFSGYILIVIFHAIYLYSFFMLYSYIQLALVAQLDACLTGDQDVVGSISARSATFFHGDWSWNIFYGHSLPSTDSRRALSVSGEKMCTVLVNCLEDQACPVKVWLGTKNVNWLCSAWLQWVEWTVKPQHKNKHNIPIFLFCAIVLYAF